MDEGEGSGCRSGTIFFLVDSLSVLTQVGLINWTYCHSGVDIPTRMGTGHFAGSISDRREKVALVGPNGASKSTLLHIMSALYMPTEGAGDHGERSPERSLRARLVSDSVPGPGRPGVHAPGLGRCGVRSNNLKLSADEVKRRVGDGGRRHKGI